MASAVSYPSPGNTYLVLNSANGPKRLRVALVRSVDRSAGTVNISWLLSKQDLPASLDLQALGGSELLVASWANACVPLSAMRNPVEVLSIPSPDALDSGTQHVLIDENSRWGRFLGISRANQKADRQLYSRFVAFRDPDTGAVEVDWDASRSAARPGEASLFPPRCGADEPWMRVCKCGQPVSLEQPMLACSVRASAQCRVVLHCKCSYRSHCAFVSEKTPPAVRLAKFAMGNIDRARPVPRGVTLLEGISAMCDACATTLRIRPRQLRGELQTVHLAVARAKQQRAEGAEQWADTAQAASVASRRGKRTLADSLCDAITAARAARDAEQPRYPKRACRSLGLTAFEPVRPAAFALHEDMECSRPRDDAALVGLETQRSTSSAVTNPPPYRVKVTHVFGTSFGARRAEGSCTPATAGPVMTSANPAALVGWRASVPRVSQCC